MLCRGTMLEGADWSRGKNKYFAVWLVLESVSMLQKSQKKKGGKKKRTRRWERLIDAIKNTSTRGPKNIFLCFTWASNPSQPAAGQRGGQDTQNRDSGDQSVV